MAAWLKKNRNWEIARLHSSAEFLRALVQVIRVVGAS
jgi:hypothetical protein